MKEDEKRLSDQKHECEKGAKFGTNGFADKRIVI